MGGNSYYNIALLIGRPANETLANGTPGNKC